ncbi:hypothetical protein WDZ92_37875, partial [Nostoc sp. NIES-2111]
MVIVASHAAMFFLTSVLMHDPLIPLTGTPLLAHAFLALGTSVLALHFMSAIGNYQSTPWVGGWLGFLGVIPLTLLGTTYSLLDSGNLSTQAQFLTSFLL